jgi:hypothetical protein
VNYKIELIPGETPMFKSLYAFGTNELGNVPREDNMGYLGRYPRG